MTREIKYRVLSRLGIWVTGIYDVSGEQVSWYVRQTPLRKFLNWFWDGINNRRYGNPCPPHLDGDLLDFDYLPERKTW